MQSDVARIVRFSEIRIGDLASRQYVMTPRVYRGFLDLFKDYNPLHTEESYAKKMGFQNKLMHGAILNGWVSHFVGMIFPGRFAMIHSVEIQFKKPFFIGDKILLESRVKQKVEALRVIVLSLKFTNLTQGNISAIAKIQAGMLR